MSKNLLIIGFVWPEPKSSAAGSRMLQLIKTFQLAEYKITFASPCAKTDNAFNLESINVSPTTIELNHTSFDTFVKNLDPEVVLFDRFMMEEQFGWRVAEQCPNALRVLDTEDLHCLRKGRQQAFKDKKKFNESYLFGDFAKREIASIYRCDLSLIISETEMDILKHQFKIHDSLLLYTPFMLESVSENDIKRLPNFESRNHFITIGNFLHDPNYNAVLYLKESIWPLIKKKLPKAELHVYGAYASQKVNQLHNVTEGFLIKGFTEDVNSVMQVAKVCLVPVRYGAGLKGKIVDAMKNGTPVVTTSIGAEGMFGNLEPNAFIEDNPEAFALKSIQLYEDKQTWGALQANGFRIINNRFDKYLHQQQLLDEILKIVSQLNEHRMKNFTGQMLQHHTLKSTKFMSKWIEEKHKNE
jgi:glycosyltransferase involved in cell wall biosynthesis